MLLLLAIVAFVAGFIDAVAGGGGMLTVPTFSQWGFHRILHWVQIS
ncbi:hypothetical protein JCM19231_858 [Vibrio ishigakensis]|uniref:Membrane transporter protein n=1 Tax=Vibrio ishigakensis TaxID=1481914 RepID=A0A0B8NZQ2_9VIBR|nr:hypothetical protein JCM19231_858 [Vibrio ishigakensis]